MGLPDLKPWSALLLLLAAADLSQCVKQTPALARFEEAIGRKLCPSSCSETGSKFQKWTNFQTMDDLILCEEEVKLLSFPLYTESLLPEFKNSIKACSTTDHKEKKDQKRAEISKSGLKSSPLTFRLAGQDDESADADEALEAIESLASALASEDGIGSNLYNTTILAAQSGNTVAGVYLGARIDRQSTASEILSKAKNYVKSTGPVQSLIGQSCGDNVPADYVAGVVVSSSGRSALEDVRLSLKTWKEAGCVQGPDGASARMASEEKSTVWVTEDNSKILEKIVNFKGDLNATVEINTRSSVRTTRSEPLLHARADCRMIRVEDGDSCGALASKCKITPAKFTEYNSYDKDLCSTLRAGQPVCCSSGDLPDIRPKPDGDKCALYTAQTGHSCASIAASNGLTNKELADFNDGKVWGWSGCTNILEHAVLCVSKGDPPMPLPLEGVACGPQKPDGDEIEGEINIENLANMNPCPLNVCCNFWGYCGTLDDFCTVTGDKPGEVRPGTNGCISNCGTEIVNNDEPPSEFIKIAYFEGWNHNRECLHMDVDSIDSSRFTHIHFSFIDISPTFEIFVADDLKEQFAKFKTMSGIKKVIAFGGWAASTHPSTYWIFREGVKPANRVKLAGNIINFLNEHGLDGVDMDWEYPAAPDLPGIPAGDPVNGPDYQAFLAVLRRRLTSGQSLSIAAPASYWYLKGIPIKEIAKIVDYIVYMTYDLHGQWDVGNPWVSPGCDGGNCLRSHINMTETMNALAMVTKAGVPSNKVIVGVTSYGRSFHMADPDCIGVNCKFTGDAENSNAEKGWCTDTAGYISDAEISAIKTGKNHNNVRHINDRDSESQILVWDDNWVAYMDRNNKNSRESKYRGLNFGGTTDWAVDLESFSPFDFGHPGIFFGIPDDDEDFEPPKMCDIRTWEKNDEARQYMVDEVSKFLYQKLRSGGTKDWADDRWYDGEGNGDGEGGDTSGSGCGDLHAGQCDWSAGCRQSYAKNYWIMSQAGNFLSSLRLLEAATDAAWKNNSYYSEVVKEALPVNGQKPEDRSVMTSLLANFGNSFGILAGALGAAHPMTAGLVGSVGAILSLAKDNVDEEEQVFQDFGKALNTIWLAYYDAVIGVPGAIFVDGNILGWSLGAFQDNSKYPVSKDDESETDKANRIVNFFHGRFFTWTGAKQEDLTEKVDKAYKQFITNAALSEGNYYIIKGGYFEEDCEGQNSGHWIDGNCYTLEHKGEGYDGWRRDPPRKDYSVPVSDDMMKFFEDEAEVDFKQLYANAEECQTHHDGYDGEPSLNLDNVVEPTEKYARCAWNIPVLSVDALGVNKKGHEAADASPCACTSNFDGGEDKVGHHFLPKRLEKIFGENYCRTFPDHSRKGGPGTNDTETEEMDDLS